MGKIKMDSLITVLADVEKLGFTSQFEVNGEILTSLKTNKKYMPKQIKIVHFYRFEGASSQDDSAIMYAIETDDNEKGTLVDGYGTTADTATADFMRAVNEMHK
ncbi:hypothetical protein HNQ02_001359 [Flavobacterium sp. 7E]|uniref:hypothetical protein n=1 Tax=Flavobacterium sp. 7E TaxID=2735898 RepID=UPI00156DDA48|nr:hypothetical protein [Flavobacterium sp. 7E]NRS88445.1 hypothetical protein [Flavobacterium sp. 7E]